MISYFKTTKNIFFFLIFFLIIFKFFNTFYNTYSILLWDYSNRMTQAYGFCKNESWGFYNHVIKKYNLKNQKINIINNEGHVVLDALFKDIDIVNKGYKYLIILNYQSEDNQDIYNSKIEYIKNFSIKYRFNNCYLLELND
mgnify:FL=1